MSESLLNILEGAVETFTQVAEHSGGRIGEAEAQTLSSQIRVIGASIEGLKAAAEENPALAIAAVATGIALASALPVATATAAVATVGGDLAGLFGVSGATATLF